jgi:hypothetical protein
MANNISSGTEDTSAIAEQSHDQHQQPPRRGSEDDAVSIIQTFLLPDSHGRCRRFCCECLLIVGFMLPLLGPLLGLCVFVPFLDLQFEEGSVIQLDTPCYGPDPTICDTTFSFDYYFWNITNPVEVSFQPSRSLPKLQKAHSMCRFSSKM